MFMSEELGYGKSWNGKKEKEMGLKKCLDQ